MISAQEVSKFKLGFEGGAGVSVFQGLLKPGMGYNGGFTCTYMFTDLISVKSGVNYDHRQSRDEILLHNMNGDVLSHYKNKFNYDFVSMPVLLKLNFGNHIKFFVETGPEIAYLVNRTFLSEDQILNTTTLRNYTDLNNRFDIRVDFGIGMCFPLSDKLDLSFNFRNSFGFGDLSNTTIKSNSTLLLVGMSFGL